MPIRPVHVVSHGPHCLDGVTAAVAVARYYGDRAEVAGALREQQRDRRACCGRSRRRRREHELWITDISWREPATDAHLRALAAGGIAHLLDRPPPHRARARAAPAASTCPSPTRVLSEEFAASRLVYEYLARASRARGPARSRASRPSRRSSPWPTTTTAGCTACPARASWPGWCARSARTRTRTSSALDERVDLHAAHGGGARARRGRDRAQLRGREREPRRAARRGGVRVVAAVCDGHPSEIADAWGKETPDAVFALYDATSLAVSLRRSPDCHGRPLEGRRGARRRRTRGRRRLRAARAAARIVAEIVATRVAEHVPVKPVLTHVALGVRDLERTIDFYRRHVRLHVVHERHDGDVARRLAERARRGARLRARAVRGARRLAGVAPSTLQHLGFAVELARGGRRRGGGRTRATASSSIPPHVRRARRRLLLHRRATRTGTRWSSRTASRSTRGTSRARDAPPLRRTALDDADARQRRDDPA